MGKTTTKRWKTFIFVVEMRRKKGWSQAGGKRVLVVVDGDEVYHPIPPSIIGYHHCHHSFFVSSIIVVFLCPC